MNPLIILLPLLLIALAACSTERAPTPAPISQSSEPVSNPYSPPPAPADPAPVATADPATPAEPIPPAAPAPPAGPKEAILFQSDFSQPSIGLKLAVTQDTPVQVTNPEDGIYGTFDRPADQGDACVDPGPNAYYHTDSGVLYLHTISPGFPICTKRSFARNATLGMEATMAALSVDRVNGCFGGLVCYDGEANWYALYFSNADEAGYAFVRVWGPYDGMITAPLLKVTIGEFVDFGIYYKHGEPAATAWKFTAGGVEMPFPFKPSMDSGIMLHDPHLAVFAGSIDMAVKRLVVKEIG